MTPHRHTATTSRDERRRAALASRAAIPDTHRTAMAAAAADRAARWLADNTTHTASLAMYLPIRGEIDPLPLIAALRCLGHAPDGLYLPRITEQTLTFHAVDADDPQSDCEPGPLGTMQPLRSRPAVAPTALDVVVVPLVACDARGNRLGYGGGFYDRTFAHAREWDHRPTMVGLAYESQVVDALEPQPWDVRLDAVVTDRALYLA